ncbi:MAG: hypothetical protein Faunusvirus2_40 [Faunusvirus sp.]|jgi:ankyrin repeat protein|uniref:Uncharacterized protein n=1 Tax=Faunusvirus sp. TaxID=2487766 RepID=A0A3G4ZZU2_9VIRU|nr:MAG: hypothetical protein Faunusvirus2_40 [Faunusvirus sp.]
MSAVAIDHAAEFIKLVRDENEAKCIEYIDKYNDFYNIYVHSSSPLTCACVNGMDTVAYKLLDCGADINLSDDGWHSLMWACFQRHTNLALELIRRGANVNNVSQYGTTALRLACRYMCIDIAIALIKAGAHFVDIIDTHILCSDQKKIIQYVREVYRQQIMSVINDDTNDNALATSFRTTYAVGVVDMISEFII